MILCPKGKCFALTTEINKSNSSWNTKISWPEIWKKKKNFLCLHEIKVVDNLSQQA